MEMAMRMLAQLEEDTKELTAAVKIIADCCRSIDASADASNTPHALLSHTASPEAQRARHSAIATVAKLQTLLSEPADFLQQLAVQNQLLSCVQWLGEFQILACIPLSGNITFNDVAELTGVPEAQLCRVVRMAATAGFLHEPWPGHVTHTPLSAQFVTKPSLLDAAMFLSQTAAPSALQMALTTQRFGHSKQTNESAYNVAFNTSQTFAGVYEQRPKLQRQWLAYLRYGMGDAYAGLTDVLTRLDWVSLGSACVVEVGVQSSVIATALTTLYPALHFVVQVTEPGRTNGHVPQQSISNRWPTGAPHMYMGGTSLTNVSKISGELSQQLSSSILVQQRTTGMPQTISDAAVYILHIPLPSPGLPSLSIQAQITAELKAHIGVLHANTSAVLILIVRLLPEPGSLDHNIESVVRLYNLTLNQLANEQENETLDLIDIINSVRDSTGHFVLVNKLGSRNNANVVYEIRYQAYTDSYKLRPALVNS